MTVKDSIYDYTDYRRYLKDVYLRGKAGQPRFSHRSFSAKLGFTSPNYVKMVMDGDRNLSPASLEKVVQGLGLKKKEAEYFSYLVFFDQAKSSIDKNYYFGLIANFKTKSNVAELESNQYSYYTDWYNPVIRELVVGLPEDLDFKILAALLEPAILPKEAKKSVQLLRELGLIAVDDRGCYYQTSALLQASSKVQNLSIRNFHKKMSELGGKAIEAFPLDKRNISSVTVKISPQGYKKLAKRVENFREELMQIVKEDENVRDVYQINFQIFPLIKFPKKGNEGE